MDESLLENIDIVLEVLKKWKGCYTSTAIFNHIKDNYSKIVSYDEVMLCLKVLIKDNFATLESEGLFYLTNEGWILESYSKIEYEKQEVKKLDRELKESVINSNTSSKTYGKNMRNLTFVLVSIAVINLAIEILKYKNTSAGQVQEKSKLQSLDNVLQSHLKSDSLFRKKVNDSLKTP